MNTKLGTFGFLSSADVDAKGAVNAGLLDQRFALRWVQAHIAQFGGDPSHVTIAGESSGAGSVLLHAIEQIPVNETLFTNVSFCLSRVLWPRICWKDDSE